MNPSAQRIRDLFNKADYSDPYWGHFAHWLSGNSRKDKMRLLASPGWSQQEMCTMLALMHRIEPHKWFSCHTAAQHQMLFQICSVRKNEDRDGVQTELSRIRNPVIKQCWLDAFAQNKFLAWSHWRCGIQAGDNTATRFMMECMQEWKPATSRAREIKVEALVATFDELVDRDNLYFHMKDFCMQRYGEILREEVQALAKDWTFAPSSVQTWRQLQGYPDFLECVPHPHPWMESLSVIRSGPMVFQLPQGHTFKNTTMSRCDRLVRDNALNPLDKPLAMALAQHFSKEPVTPAPAVAGLYGLLDGVNDMTEVLLSLSTMGPTSDMHVDTALFEVAP